MGSIFGRPDSPGETLRRHRARRWLAERLGGVLVEDFVLGANDGVITTFAVVAGSVGGHLGAGVILILGFANLFADGVSMAASNYLGRRSREDYVRRQRQMEEWEVEHTPEEELRELHELFANMGLDDAQVEHVAHVVAESKPAWVEIMLAHELGLAQSTSSPIKHGAATLAAFVIAGFVPLLPYLFHPDAFALSSVAAAAALFAAGALRTIITGVNWLRGGLEMLGVGSAAAVVAYGIGRLIASFV